jgi:RNA polymerase sigma factor (sigma-70 family)
VTTTGDNATPEGGGAVTLQHLAERALGGDEAAFEGLHRRLGGGLRNFIQRRVGGAEELVEELAQAAWVEVWRSLDRGTYDPGKARITTFVYAVGYKMVLRYQRDRRRGGGVGALPGVADDPALWLHEALADTLHTSELVDAVRDCLRRPGSVHSLTAEERAVALGAATGRSERDLAGALGLAPSTVNARKKSAYEKLRKCLSKKGFASDLSEQGDG